MFLLYSQKYAGREVQVESKKVSYKMPDGTVLYEGTRTDLKKDDPVVADLTAEAKKHGLTVRLWLPDSMGTMDLRYDRLNVRIEPESDGKYRIQPHFGIG